MIIKTFKFRNLVKTYRDNPREFWANDAHRSHLHDSLVDCALYAHSIKPAAANSESEFSKMARMITPIRNSYTPENAGLRLRIKSQLPLKRKLQIQMREHGIKNS